MSHKNYLRVHLVCLVAVFLMALAPAQAARSEAANRPAGITPPNAQHKAAAEALLQQIWSARSGADKFKAIDAVVSSYRRSDAATQNAIAWLSVAVMNDRNRAILDRWPCAYVIGKSGHTPALSHLIDVLLRDPVEVMRAVAAEALGGWYLSTGIPSIREALLQADRVETSARVRETITKYLSKGIIDPGPTPPSDTHRLAAEDLLQQIWDAQPGAPKFQAIDAVVKSYASSNEPTRYAIAWLCTRYMKDPSRGVLDRWPCEYVLSKARYEPAIPELINILLTDNVDAMRAVAAEALGAWFKSTNNTSIYDALMQSARTEKSQWVRDTLAKYLGGSMPNLETGS